MSRSSPFALKSTLVALLVALSALPALAQQDSEDPEMRIEQLEARLRQLTGQNEELQYRNRQLEEQLKQLQGGQGPRANVAAAPPGPAGLSSQQPTYQQPPPAYPQAQPQPQSQPQSRRASNPRRPPADVAVATSLIPSPIPMRQARRGRLAALSVSRRRPLRQMSAHRAAVAPANRSTSPTPIRRRVALPASRRRKAIRNKVIRSRAQRHSSRRPGRRLLRCRRPTRRATSTTSATAISSARTMRWPIDAARVPAEVSERPAGPRSNYWLGESSVSAAALSRRCRILPNHHHQVRELLEGARCLVAARPVACGAEGEGGRMRGVRRGDAQIPEGLRRGKAGRRP